MKSGWKLYHLLISYFKELNVYISYAGLELPCTEVHAKVNKNTAEYCANIGKCARMRETRACF